MIFFSKNHGGETHLLFRRFSTFSFERKLRINRIDHGQIVSEELVNFCFVINLNKNRLDQCFFNVKSA